MENSRNINDDAGDANQPNHHLPGAFRLLLHNTPRKAINFCFEIGARILWRMKRLHATLRPQLKQTKHLGVTKN